MKNFKEAFISFVKTYKLKMPKSLYIFLPLVTLVSFFTSGVLLFNHFSSTPQVIAASPEPEKSPLPNELDPNFLRQVNECLIPTAAVYGYILRITSGFRTLEEQDKLYAQGRTTDGPIVTEAPASKSIHNYGYAVDFADIYQGYEVNWHRLKKIGEYCGLEQLEGDVTHFEHRGGLTTTDFANGKRPAALILPCQVMADKAKHYLPLSKADLKNCGAPNF